jgi:hypothetical protein
MKYRVPQNTRNLWTVCIETSKVPRRKVQTVHLSVSQLFYSVNQTSQIWLWRLSPSQSVLWTSLCLQYWLTAAKECQVSDVTDTKGISGACGTSGVRCKFHETKMAIVIRFLHSQHNGEVTSACLNPSSPVTPRKNFTNLELHLPRVCTRSCRVPCDIATESPVQSVWRVRVSRHRLLILSLSWFISVSTGISWKRVSN